MRVPETAMAPADSDVEEFIDKVSEVERLIEGLKKGTISAEYVDTKLAERQACKDKPRPESAKSPWTGQQPTDCVKGGVDSSAEDKRKQERLLAKVEELKANRARKLKARNKYHEYVENGMHNTHSTDYQQWDLWCPSDDEDDLFNSLTPNTAEFRAMEKDISDRHNRCVWSMQLWCTHAYCYTCTSLLTVKPVQPLKHVNPKHGPKHGLHCVQIALCANSCPTQCRMVEQRQLAERQRVQGNAAYKQGQYSEALRCYELGLESQRHNMALHANAAMAAIKIKCFAQALAHCDKVGQHYIMSHSPGGS